MPQFQYGPQTSPYQQQQMSENPFYNPTMPGPDWYRGIMALYANLAGAKEKKKAGEQEAEDREWQKLLKETELNLRKQQVEQGKREYETPDQRAAREAAAAKTAHGYRMTEIAETLKRTEAKAAGKEAKAQEDLEYKERKSQIAQNRKDRDAKRKEFNQTVLKIGVNERRIAELKSKASQAASKGDTVSVSTWAQEKERLATENAVLEAYRDSMYKDVLPESTGATTKYKAGDTKVVGGVTYYYWSDGGWHSNPESSPQKR